MTAGCWAGLSPVDFRRLPLHAPIHPSFLGAAWRMGVEPCVGSSESCPLATRDAPGVCFDFLFGILAAVGLLCCSHVLSWRAGAALTAVNVLLVAVASLVREHGLWAGGLQSSRSRAQSTGSVVGVPGLSCPVACGVFLDQRSNARLLHWQADSLPLGHQGSPFLLFY